MTKRTRDPWGDQIREAKRRDPWGDATESRKGDPWGDPARPPMPSPLPACAALFQRVEKIEGARTHDAWGEQLTETGMPRDEFARAVAMAQSAIFEKARPSRPSDHDTALYVDAMTNLLRGESATDAELVHKLRDCGSWPHVAPNLKPRQAQPPARLERKSGPATLTPNSKPVAERTAR